LIQAPGKEKCPLKKYPTQKKREEKTISRSKGVSEGEKEKGNTLCAKGGNPVSML